jgi:hypothetical protein
MSSQQELLQAELDLQRNENALLKQKLDLLEQKEIADKAAFAEATVKAQEQADADYAAHQADERLRFAQLNIPRPETMKAYSALSTAVKSRLIDEFGANFPAEIRSKESTGMDWQTWDKLNHPERCPITDKPKPWRPRDYVDGNGITVHFDDARNCWMPGPSPEK